MTAAAVSGDLPADTLAGRRPRRRPHRSLRTRIAVACAIAMVIAIALASIGIYVALRSEQLHQVRSSLSSASRGINRHFPGQDGGGPNGDGSPPDLPGAANRINGGPFGGQASYVQFIGTTGSVLRPEDEVHALPVNATDRRIATSGSGRQVRTLTVDGTHVMVLTSPATNGGATQVALPLTDVDHVLRRTIWILAGSSLAGILIAVLLAALAARGALAPVDRFIRRSEDIADELDPSLRMEPEGALELVRLAHSFNATLDALERAVESQRHLVADASHELRTPLSSIRANIQLMEHADRLPEEDRTQVRRDIIDELDELTNMVGDIVELARGSAPEAERDDVFLDDLVRAAAERVGRRARGHVEFDLDLDRTLLHGDAAGIDRAVVNLLDNARAWSPTGGVVEVTLRDGQLAVRDHGPGFAEDDVSRVFDRFFRSETARGKPGSGLGLAIVRQAAEAHAGSVSAGNAPDGGALLRASFGPPLTL